MEMGIAPLDTGFDPADSAALVVDRDGDFRVNGAVYTDPELFRREMDVLFGRCWIYVGHDSEIPNAGDYRTSYIGLRPVIVVRGDDGTIRVLLNRCRHRGSVICRETSGNAKDFQCRYHGWTYANTGDLIAIAQHRGGYPDDIDKSKLGLIEAPRVETYRGMIFACMDAKAQSLNDYLGPARRFIDLQFDRAPGGRIEMRYGTHRTEYRGNWKFQAENSTDGYHGDTVHESFWRVMAEFGNKSGRHGAYTETNLQDILKQRRTGYVLGYVNGHGMLEYPLSAPALEAMRNGPHASYFRTLEEKHGRDGLAALFNAPNLLVFPNLALLHGQIRLIRPVAVDRTEVTIQLYGLDGAPGTYEQERLAGYQRFFGPSSFGSPDDVEIFAMNQVGLQATEVEWLILSRGMQNEKIVDNFGTRSGAVTDEVPQRAFHRAWKRVMGV
jgi:benzoate/toluate 1,2-dioxygenase subunit alpha